MRVIGGKFKGRKLSAFKGSRIRPTTDRVREAVFNILSPFLPCELALDLYAGTGAMGIEALSRGVKKAHFVDSNSVAIKIIEKNIETLSLGKFVEIIKRDVDGFLDATSTRKAHYDLIFIDPPYNAGLGEATLKKVAALRVIKEGAVIVVEVGKHEPISVETLEGGFSGLEQIDFRKYGDNLIYIFKRNS